jgi:hypothetical protein
MEAETKSDEAKHVERLYAKAREAAAGKGDVMVVETDVPGIEVAAFRVPTTMEWSAYKVAKGGEKEMRAGAGRPLVIRTCIFPDQDTFGAALDTHPGLVETFENELVGHAGAGRAKKVSKL